MRIVHVVVTANFAGVERYVSDTSRALSQRGHEVHVIGGDPQRMPAEVGPQVVWWPGCTPRAAMRSLLRVRAPEIVHAHMTKAESVALPVALSRRSRFFSTRHFARTRGAGVPGRLASRLINAALDRQIAMSTYVAERIERPPDLVLRGGVAAAEARAGACDRALLVLQRLEIEKETRTALEAWALSGLADRGWRLDVAGDGAERPRLRQQALDLGMGASVRFLGYLKAPAAALDRCAALVATTPVEALGLSVLEAMARAVPVLAVGAGGYLETVARVESPLLHPAGDPRVLAENMRWVADNEAQARLYGLRLQQLQRDEFEIGRHVRCLLEQYSMSVGQSPR